MLKPARYAVSRIPPRQVRGLSGGRGMGLPAWGLRDDALQDFRILARGFAKLGADQIARLLDDNDLTEMCHEGE